MLIPVSLSRNHEKCWVGMRFDHKSKYVDALRFFFCLKGQKVLENRRLVFCKEEIGLHAESSTFCTGSDLAIERRTSAPNLGTETDYGASNCPSIELWSMQ